MLKLGNTYLNFGGTYLTDWDYYKEPVIENGWSELYNINPYKTFTSSNSDDKFYIDYFGLNRAYIMSAWEGENPKAMVTYYDELAGRLLSKIIQNRGTTATSSLHEDKVHIGDKNFTYLLYKFQVSPHSVGGSNNWNPASSATESYKNSIRNNSNPLVRFYIGDDFSVENSYTPSSNYSVQMMVTGNQRFLCSSFNYTNKLNVNGTTAKCTSGVFDYLVPSEETDYVFSAYIRPQTFNYLIKLNENNIDVSAYINNFEQSANMNFAYSGTYDLNPSYFKESWKNFKIYGSNVGNWGAGVYNGAWGFRSPIIEEVGLSAYYENELNYENFKNLALRSFTANYVPSEEV